MATVVVVDIDVLSFAWSALATVVVVDIDVLSFAWSALATIVILSFAWSALTTFVDVNVLGTVLAFASHYVVLAVSILGIVLMLGGDLAFAYRYAVVVVLAFACCYAMLVGLGVDLMFLSHCVGLSRRGCGCIILGCTAEPCRSSARRGNSCVACFKHFLSTVGKI